MSLLFLIDSVSEAAPLGPFVHLDVFFILRDGLSSRFASLDEKYDADDE